MTGVELDSVQAITLAQYSTALTGSFVSMNGTGFSDNIKLLKIYVGSTYPLGVDISYDGVTLNDYWPPGATIIFDFQANHADNPPYGSGTKIGMVGQIIYGRTPVAPTSISIAGYR